MRLRGPLAARLAWAGIAILPVGILTGTLLARPSRASAFVAATRTAAARWADLRAAVAAGYVLDDRTVGVEHWINPAYLGDGHLLDPHRPEGLMYVADGTRRRLAAVFYMLDRPGQPDPTLGAPGWHHHTRCFGEAGGIGVPVPGGACPPGTSLTSTADMLHVWMPGYGRSVFSADMTPRFVCNITRAPRRGSA